VQYLGAGGVTRTSAVSPAGDAVTVTNGTAFVFMLGTTCDPNNPDTNGDGVPDGREWLLGNDLFGDDADGDGFPDSYELASGTDPNNPDTDGDGICDGDEPLYPDGTTPASVDADGLTLAEKLRRGLPWGADCSSDADGDGWEDYLETLAGTSPADPADSPDSGGGTPKLFAMTVSVSRRLSAPAVLWAGLSNRVLRGPGTHVFYLRSGVMHGISLFGPADAPGSLSVSFSDPLATLLDDGGVFGGAGGGVSPQGLPAGPESRPWERVLPRRGAKQDPDRRV